MSFAGLIPHMPSPGEVNVGTLCHTGQDGRSSECRRQTSNSSCSGLTSTISSYCETKVRFGVVEAVNGNIRMLINRGRGYQNLRYLLLKAKRMAVTNVEFIAVHAVTEAA